MQSSCSLDEGTKIYNEDMVLEIQDVQKSEPWLSKGDGLVKGKDF